MRIRLDDCTHLDSWVHQWDARFKLMALLGLMMAFASVRSIWLLPWMGLIVIGLYALSQLPLSFLTTRLRYPGLFLLGIIVLIPWLSGSTPLWQWGPLTLWQEGCLAALLIAGRFLCSVTVGFILLGTTPFLTLVKAMRSLGLPMLLTDMMLLSYRYLFEILENLDRMRRAMTLRGFNHRYRAAHASYPSLRHRLNTLAIVTGTLFIRSYEQAERVYHAMRLRGYGYRTVKPTTVQAYAPSRATGGYGWDAIALCGTLLAAIGLIVANYWLG